ncbi:hypothetical protein BURMUCF2_A0710 [Burkholderia multivorans CF2]|nr:hypothetical protein BURMUCF2_A0710 [Burkholderia multivorans CF2]
MQQVTTLADFRVRCVKGAKDAAACGCCFGGAYAACCARSSGARAAAGGGRSRRSDAAQQVTSHADLRARCFKRAKDVAACGCCFGGARHRAL